MEKKVVLIVLIVIAVVAFMFLGAGLFRGGRESTPSARSEPRDIMKKMDTLFSRARKEFDLSRMASRTDGCVLANGLLSFSGVCNLVIAPGKTKSSAFYLKRGSSQANACYAFSPGKLEECWNDGDQKSALDKPSHRFIVTSDEAFMRLECTTPLSGKCGIAVAVKD